MRHIQPKAEVARSSSQLLDTTRSVEHGVRGNEVLRNADYGKNTDRGDKNHHSDDRKATLTGELDVQAPVVQQKLDQLESAQFEAADLDGLYDISD